MSDDLKQLLAERVRSLAPQSLLMLGRDRMGLVDLAGLTATVPRIEVVEQEVLLRHWSGEDRYDLALIIGALEHLPKSEALALLSRIRDLQARRMIMVLPMGPSWSGHQSRWDPSELLALGMTLYLSASVADKPVQVYEFDIERYKATPDWLNPKHWANPELYGKYRW
ncbi:MAG: DUF6231 family protein [Gammaproteobacteria bacterium]